MKTYIQLTAGRGPAECCWVVAQVLRYLLDAGRAEGLKCTVLHREPGPQNATLYSATVSVEGKKAAAFAQPWLGTVQWVGQSQFRKMHKRKNWFIGIAEVKFNSRFAVRDQDISYEVFRSSGPGGQHVNKTSTAIRARHLQSGLFATAMDQRSQLQNKKLARERLIELLQLKETEAQQEQAQSNWKNHTALERGNPVKVFRGSDFKPERSKKGYKNKRNSLKRDLQQRLNDD